MIQRFLSNTKTLYKILRFNYIDEWEQHFIRPYNIKTPPEGKRLYKDNKQLSPYPKVRASFQDVLYMPGLDKDRLYSMQKQIITKEQIILSNQFIALLLYHLSKQKILLDKTMKIFELWIPKHKGQYTSRQIFGCIYGMLIYNKTKYIQFFLNQIQASNFEFQLSESLEIVEALNKNKGMALQLKHKLWENNFKKSFVDDMHNLNESSMPIIFRVFDAFKQFQYYDEQIWDFIISMLDEKTGWTQVSVIERLYPLIDKFYKAKMLFEKYYRKLQKNQNMAWRYNLEELRLYSSQQMIAKSQKNIKMQPSIRTLLPRQNLQEILHRYEQWLIKGSVKQEDEIIRDKSIAFGYAIKDRFYSMSKDNADFDKISRDQFQQLFGSYDEATMKDKQQNQEQPRSNVKKNKSK